MRNLKMNSKEKKLSLLDYSMEQKDPNEAFHDKPLKNMVLIEGFAGDPKAGGCQLSTCWERAGGIAHRRDTKIDQKHDFFTDDA